MKSGSKLIRQKLKDNIVDNVEKNTREIQALKARTSSAAVLPTVDGDDGGQYWFEVRVNDDGEALLVLVGLETAA